jgi:hypothetical protein
VPHPLVDDAARWWRAYVLAEDDQEDALRRLADGGDDHAQRELARWLAERGRTAEAITLIRPLADAGEDLAQLWLARWLAGDDRVGELRHRADVGDDHAWPELFDWLAWHDLDQLRVLTATLDGRPLQLLTNWLARQGNIEVLRIGADTGDDDARRRLAHWLARKGRTGELRERAEAGADHAREWLAWLAQQP